MAPTKPQRRPEKILVIHTAFLGDIVLATPFLAALRSEFPTAEIFMVTTPAGAGLLEPNPWEIKIIPFHKRGSDSGLTGLWRVGRRLRSLQPHLVFNLHRSFRSALLASISGGEIIGFREAAGAFLFSKKVDRIAGAYEPEKNLALLEAYTGRGGYSPFTHLLSSPQFESKVTELLGGRRNFVAIAPSSVWATKRWPAEKFAKLAKKIKSELALDVVIVGGNGPEDFEAAEAMQKAAGEGLLNLTGRTNLGELRELLSRAVLVISNDSSPLHVGLAMGTKALGIYGPTTRELGFFPLAPSGRAAVAELEGLECRPCGLHGHKVCPLGHFRCMLELGVDQVFAEVRSLLCR